MRKLLALVLFFSADATWWYAGAFWGFTLLALLVLWAAMTAMSANPAANQASAKAYTVETRLNAHVAAAAPAINLVANGGTIGGSVTVAGDHHIQGTLYGTGGTLTVGDATYIGNVMTANGRVTAHGGFSGSGTTGDSGQGAITGDQFGGGFGGGSGLNATAQADLNSFVSQFNAHVSDTQAIINRVNDLLNALG